MPPQGGKWIDTHLYLRTKYQELREQFTRWRNLYYLIECAWCKKRLRWIRKRDAVPGDTSHGICASCAADLVKQMQTMQTWP
jgi:hypothetical protein